MPDLNIAERIETASGIRVVLLPGGTFEMGSANGFDDERPIRSITLIPFYISVCPVTVAQYYRFCAATGYEKPVKFFNQYFWRKENHPIVHVTCSDAGAYCSWLTGITGMQCQLPTEAQWEYSARSGKDSNDYPWGRDFDASLCAHGLARKWAGTTEVGSYAPNGFGLYDMAGNVREWCQDWYAPYNASSVINPRGPQNGEEKVQRGGSWTDNYASDYRCSNRVCDYPENACGSTGFRIVVTSL